MKDLDLSVKGTTVQSIFTDYLNGKFTVNRNYQRKLVWTEQEKEYLIDSLSQQLPMPLILLAKDPTGSYEIVDGLQRINAIIGFLKNDFPLDGKFFDLERLGDTKELKDKGEISQKEPRLDSDKCRAIFNYEVPVSVYTTSSDSQVEEVFRRINSSGRHLSRQDIRQAGAEGHLPALVRAISAEIRGDISDSNIVPLSKMSQISITDGAEDSEGIKSSDIFWVKNGILDEDSIRESKDEELVLDMLMDSLSTKIIATEAKKRDEAYGFKSESEPSSLRDNLNSVIENRGEEKIKDDFMYVFKEIQSLLIYSKKGWRELTSPGTRAKVIGRYFQLMFFPFYDLLINKSKVVTDRAKLAHKLDRFWENSKIQVPKGGGTLAIKDKDRIFKHIKSTIEDSFSEGNPKVASEVHRRVRDFESDLMKSLTESTKLEFKVGLTDLQDATLNMDLLNKIPRIMSAIANSHPNGEGVIYIGVTDDCQTLSKLGINPDEVPSINGKFYCVGVDSDLRKLKTSIEDYQQLIKRSFQKLAKKDDGAKQLEKVHVSSFDYRGVSIVALRMDRIDSPILIDEKVLVRKDSYTQEVPSEELFTFFDKFKNNLKNPEKSE
ncbi:MAG: DUF262 domain-containing protein [Corynebacterium pyruviciproducens]|uniref:GmrSD restriction endonuclease domain-containing protein n=1 Tax=Corynebacterium pyruviciproducens TaxID=598660 RepID=UPI0039834E89